MAYNRQSRRYLRPRANMNKHLVNARSTESWKQDILSLPFLSPQLVRYGYRKPSNKKINERLTHTENVPRCCRREHTKHYSTSAPPPCQILQIEYEFCARRGLCDFATGLCTCLDGWTGAACSTQSYVYSASNALPGISLIASGLDYTGNIIESYTDKRVSNYPFPVRISS